jgi:Zn-dependent protease with chaperone function
MTVTVFDVTYAPVLLWVAIGGALLVTYRRSASPLVFRLAALFLAAWALLATTALVWVLSNGGGSAVIRLIEAPLTIFDGQFLTVWLIGGIGAFGVFLCAFLLSQAVGSGLLALLKPEPLAWPARLPRPGTSTSLLVFASHRADAFTFTLLERGGAWLFRRRDFVLVSDVLLRELSQAEWEAVLAHELGHVRELDGRYLTFFRTLARMMRWDPVLAYFADSLTRREEYRADLEAVRITHRPRALARALFKVLRLAPSRRGAMPGLLGVAGRRGQRETIERIRRLVALSESGRYPEDAGA